MVDKGIIKSLKSPSIIMALGRSKELYKLGIIISKAINWPCNEEKWFS